ncbi:MAG: sigma-70 family RNA polymerase sigma factor [Thermosynechococcaceae cyanobacterium]
MPTTTTPSYTTDPRSDAELIQACQTGDQAAFRWLYRRHQHYVRKTLFHLCDPTTLDDLVQEVFIRAWKGLKKMRQQAQFSTWLYRIAWNVGADYRRQMAQTHARTQKLFELSDGPVTPEWQSLHYQDMVRRGLRSLKEDHAVVVILHDLQELPQAEIAEILEIPVGTVKSRLFHARSQLRKNFQQEGISP